MLSDYSYNRSTGCKTTGTSGLNATCKEKELLLSLASEISSHVNASDLVECLEISLPVGIESETNRDKIYKLFLLWMSTTESASVPKLLTRLDEQLSKASITNTIIKKYRAGKSCDYNLNIIVFPAIHAKG